jgi:hypothetical protein
MGSPPPFIWADKGGGALSKIFLNGDDGWCQGKCALKNHLMQ